MTASARIGSPSPTVSKDTWTLIRRAEPGKSRPPGVQRGTFCTTFLYGRRRESAELGFAATAARRCGPPNARTDGAAPDDDEMNDMQQFTFSAPAGPARCQKCTQTRSRVRPRTACRTPTKRRRASRAPSPRAGAERTRREADRRARPQGPASPLRIRSTDQPPPAFAPERIINPSGLTAEASDDNRAYAQSPCPRPRSSANRPFRSPGFYPARS